MNKEFEYRGFHFNIKVELNTKVEKSINGRRWHTITTNCMDFDNYYKKEEVQDKFLIMAIKDAERLAKEYVDRKRDGVPSLNERLLMQRLSKLGFK